MKSEYKMKIMHYRICHSQYITQVCSLRADAKVIKDRIALGIVELGAIPLSLESSLDGVEVLVSTGRSPSLERQIC